MGEYAKHQGEEIKIGTCADMYYLRYEDRTKVQAIPNSVDPAKEPEGLRFRLPFPDEDHMGPGAYTDHKRGQKLYRYPEGARYPEWFPVDEGMTNSPGSFQLHHPSGLRVSVECYHGAKLPEASADLRPFWNGFDTRPELAMVKVHYGQLVPIIRCSACGEMFRSTWEDVLPFIPDAELAKRCAAYAGELVEA